ncbi:MAG TPA: transglutaminaseTgpA domain-containing protein [Streptosporangiaceae bacterium]|jgi:transglutaminase-like putative cysteine protease
MNYRLTITAAIAVVLSSFSLFTVILGTGWLYAGMGAVLVVAAAGLATRLSAIPAAAVATVITAICLMPLLTQPSWPARIGGLAVLAAVAASAIARKVLALLAGACTYLGALLLYLNLVFAAGRSFSWLVPTTDSLHELTRLVNAGFAERIYAPPVPGIRGMELVAAAGVGIVAVLTDLVAVRLRSPAVAGLPLLVLFSVPVATSVKHAGVGLTLAFCLGITGYLAMLAADGRDRLRLWGRLVTVWQQAPADDEDEPARGPDTRALAASGRRIGLAAVALAVIAPLVLPGLKEHGLLSHGGAGTGTGSGGAPAPEPLVQMRSQLQDHSDTPFLTYRSTAADPTQQYMQVYVLNLDNSSGQWTLTSRSPSTSVGAEALRPAPGLASSTTTVTTRTTITIGKAAGYTSPLSYLPIPYAPVFLSAPGGGWRETNSTLMVYGLRPDAGLRYTVTSRLPTPSVTQLTSGGAIPASIRDSYLAYTGPDKAQLLQIARTITAGSQSRLSQALALQNYFTTPGRFTYALNGNLPSTVYQFLTSNKRGFCQQFAFSMAVLARLLGIPSRIAVGYTGGTENRHRLWRVTTGDAHAWPELYFPGSGWIRFEPTPGGAGGQGTATSPVFSSTTPGSPPTVGPAPGVSNPATAPSSSPSAPLGNLRGVTGGNKTPNGGGGGAGSGGFPVGLLIAVLAAVLLVSPGLTRVAIRRRRWLAAGDDAGRAHAAWRELLADLTDYGLDGVASESPRALARRVVTAAGLDEPEREAVSRIASAEERARYAPAPAPGESLQADSQLVRRAIARSVSPRRRWRARLAPASVLAPVLNGLRQAPDAFGWADAAGLRIRRRMSTTIRPRRAH